MTFIGDIFGMIVDLADFALHNIIGLGIFCIVVFILWLFFMRPKPRNIQQEIFNKLWDTTSTRLRLKAKKTVAICTYPDKIEDLRKTPIHQLNYTVEGEIVGVNAVGVESTLNELIKYSDLEDEEGLNKILELNKEWIEQDKFWLIFAYTNKTKGFILPKVKRGLLFVKPYQIINQDSSDNIIRLKGIGLRPVGEYEIVVDDFMNINKTQLVMDTIKNINEEVLLGSWAQLSQIVEAAMKSDSLFRKETALEGIKVLPSPGRSEVPQE